MLSIKYKGPLLLHLLDLLVLLGSGEAAQQVESVLGTIHGLLEVVAHVGALRCRSRLRSLLGDLGTVTGSSDSSESLEVALELLLDTLDALPAIVLATVAPPTSLLLLALWAIGIAVSCFATGPALPVSHGDSGVRALELGMLFAAIGTFPRTSFIPLGCCGVS